MATNTKMFNTLSVDDITNQETAQHLNLINNVHSVRNQIILPICVGATSLIEFQASSEKALK